MRSLPEDVHGRPGSRLHVYKVQQVLQDVEQLSEAQVRTTAVQVPALPVCGVQGVHPARAPGRATLQGHLVEHVNPDTTGARHQIALTRVETSTCLFYARPGMSLEVDEDTPTDRRKRDENTRWKRWTSFPKGVSVTHHFSQTSELGFSLLAVGQ